MRSFRLVSKVNAATVAAGVSATTSIPALPKEGRFQFAVFASLAELNREIIVENTLAGLRAARARSKTGGRKRALSPAQVDMAACCVNRDEITQHAPPGTGGRNTARFENQRIAHNLD